MNSVHICRRTTIYCVSRYVRGYKYEYRSYFVIVTLLYFRLLQPAAVEVVQLVQSDGYFYTLLLCNIHKRIRQNRYFV